MSMGIWFMLNRNVKNTDKTEESFLLMSELQ